MNFEKKLLEHCEENGIEGLLPQNLTDMLFNRLLEEISSIDSENGKVAPSLFLLTVLSLKNGHCLTTNPETHIQFDGEKDLMKSFENYEMAITLEAYRRNATIELSEASLPTVKNIFDGQRNIKFEKINI